MTRECELQPALSEKIAEIAQVKKNCKKEEEINGERGLIRPYFIFIDQMLIVVACGGVCLCETTRRDKAVKL